MLYMEIEGKVEVVNCRRLANLETWLTLNPYAAGGKKFPIQNNQKS